MPAFAAQVPLGELIRLAFPPGTSALPRPQRDRLVRWVATAAPGIAPAEGDLMLCTQCPPAVDLQTWARLGAAGAACLSGVVPPTDLPVVQLPAGASLRDIQQAALQLLANRQAYLAERGTRVHQQLLHHSLEGAGLQALAQTMTDLTGKAVLIQDKRLAPLAQSPQPALAATWPDLVTRLGQAGQLPEGLRDRRSAPPGSWQAQDLSDGLSRLVGPIVAKGLARGYLSLVGLADEFDVLDQLVVEHGAAACALEMAKAKAVSEAEKRAYGDFVDAVLTRALPAEELALWARRLNYDLSALHSALVWRWAPGPATPSLRRLETLAHQAVAQLGAAAIVRPRGSEVAAFCAVLGPGRPETALALGQAVLRMAAEEYPEAHLFAGLGRPVPDVGQWGDTYREASQALNMALRLDEPGLLYFADLAVHRLLFQMEGNPELEAFCREVLGPLLDYQGGGDLLETLEAFCDRLGNLSQTAEKLFIHRNSLLYRMERIADLTGLDLDNPDTRLAVHLALKIRKMLQAPHP